MSKHKKGFCGHLGWTKLASIIYAFKCASSGEERAQTSLIIQHPPCRESTPRRALPEAAAGAAGPGPSPAAGPQPPPALPSGALCRPARGCQAAMSPPPTPPASQALRARGSQESPLGAPTTLDAYAPRVSFNRLSSSTGCSLSAGNFGTFRYL